MASANSVRRNRAFILPTAPATRLEANRWLNYATFGAATARTDIAASTKTSFVNLVGETDDATRLMSIGYEAYINEQLADNTIPDFSSQSLGLSVININNSGQFKQLFWTQALHGTAQIRQKLAYALSQIFVVNVNSADIAEDATFKLAFYQRLLEATLSTNTSSYRNLFLDVVLSKPMAVMLTYLNNKKRNLSIFQRPDQNAIREFMQLFCPGLHHQNMDGTFVLDSNGQKIPTYTPDMLDLLADFITGMGDNALGGVSLNSIPTQRLYENAADHENAAKTLPSYLGQAAPVLPAQLAGACRLNFEMPAAGYQITVVDLNTFTISGLNPSRNNLTPRSISYRMANNLASTRFDGTVSLPLNGTTATVTRAGHGRTTGEFVFVKGNVRESVDFLLDHLFNHPTAAPFVAKSLIKYFVTSNPTPEYVKRVALKFVDNGNGIRGDLSAVVKAILLDREAILPFGVNPNNHGRYTTIVDRILRTSRAFRSDNIHFNRGKRYAGSVFTKPADFTDYEYCFVGTTNSILPFSSPSIFNFFLPEFQPKGEILADIDKKLPEAQIEVTGTKVGWMNTVAQLCDTKIGDGFFDAAPNVLQNPTRGEGNFTGFEFNPHSGGVTIGTITGNNAVATYTQVAAPTTTGGHNLQFSAKRRGGDGQVFNTVILSGGLPIGAGAKSVTLSFFPVTGLVATDVLDVQPLFYTGVSGFPNYKYIVGGGGNGIGGDTFPNYILFYRVANLTPNGAAVPTALELAPAIDYLESILMGRKISDGARALMVQAAQVPVADIAPRQTGDATYNNHYANQVMNRAQKRARAMVAMLLVSPEYSSLR